MLKNTGRKEENEVPSVSVIIPVYNTPACIDRCITSVCKQTLSDIEIIASEIGLTDETLSLLQKHAQGDKRLQIIMQERNVTEFQSYKNAVLKSHGACVMFVDQDDYLEPTACETIYHALVNNDADIIQYGSFLESDLPKKTVEEKRKSLTPYTGKPITVPMVTACFEQKLLSANIWNKAFAGDAARRAFTKMEDGNFPEAGDVYILFFLLMECRRYYGVAEPLYHSCLSRELAGSDTMTLEQFSVFCQNAGVYRALDLYIKNLKDNAYTEESILTEVTAAGKAVNAIKAMFLDEQIWYWLNSVPQEYRGDAFCIMEQAWAVSGTEFISMLARRNWNRRKDLANALIQCDRFRFQNRPIRTVALYYRSIRSGGAERVVAMLSKMFAEYQDGNGEYPFKVILLVDEKSETETMTDEEIAAEEYEVGPLVIRETLPQNAEFKKGRYETRARRWAEIVEKHDVDVVLYSLWLAEAAFWDLLCVKQLPSRPAFIFHAHTFCCYLYQLQTDLIEERTTVFRMADGLIALSETDRLYWSRINPNVYFIPNPCCFRTSENKQVGFSKNIVWVARLAAEKQPRQIVSIMEKVVSADSEAVCHVIGKDNGHFTEILKTEIAARGLEKNIILEGFHRNVEQFYKNASIFLMTSLREGYPLAPIEAASFGLPTVAYHLPWISFFKTFDGWTVVPQGDSDSAARAILQLTGDKTLWQEKSDAAYKSALAQEDYNIMNEWRIVFRNLEDGRLADGTALDETTRLYLDQITHFHGIAVRKMTSRINAADRAAKDQKKMIAKLEKDINIKKALLTEIRAELEKEKKRNRTLQRRLKREKEENKRIRESRSYRIGRILTWPIRQLRDMF